jgi:arylsulfatase A-like enzyme
MSPTVLSSRPKPTEDVGKPEFHFRYTGFELGAAVSVSAVALVSSMYCLLAYIPSTYFAFIHAPFLNWMPMFAKAQPFLFSATFCWLAAVTYKAFRNTPQSRLAIEIITFGIAGSTYLLWTKPLSHIQNNSSSFVLAIAFLAIPVFAGALEYSAWLANLEPDLKPRASASYLRVIAAAVFISLSYPAATYVRYYMAGGRNLPPKADLIALIWAAFTLVFLFLIFFSLLHVINKLAESASNPRKLRFVLFTLFSWLTVALVLHKVLLASIPFEGLPATIYATVLALAVAIMVGGRLLRAASVKTLQSSDSSRPSSRVETAGLWFFLLAANLTVPALIGALDWNSILEKTWALAYWALAASVIVFRQPKPRPRRLWVPIGTAALSIFALRVGAESQSRWAGALLNSPAEEATMALERHSSLDASFAASSDLLATTAAPRPCNEQCEFLEENTNIAASAQLSLHNLDLVSKLAPVPGDKPNIFVIVVDSLRQDYVSAYNPAVSFTPAIGAFARDSIVFRNAFTRYAGTTLSEPSIWSGMLPLHKHYVQPFHLVNGLEKLIQTDGYKPFISVDTVLRVLLEPRPDAVELDRADTKWTDLDFCSTSTEALNRMDSSAKGRPIFLYTQPQNIHIATLSKTSSLRPPKRDYSPFVSTYASELERLDGCFGRFINGLKQRGLYENSIIVFTADHGEDLKTLGPERHAFSLKPDVIKVPLIIHVPQRISRTWYYDPEAIAFNTDIAATLYEVLGHGPVLAKPEYGRPLLTRTKTAWDGYASDSYLIASSYGPMYGVLSENGKKLFIENEVSGIAETEEFFDLRSDPEATHNVITSQIRNNGEAQVRGFISGIANLYGYRYKAPSILDWLMR